jgi:hypothetical protein
MRGLQCDLASLLVLLLARLGDRAGIPAERDVSVAKRQLRADACPANLFDSGLLLGVQEEATVRLGGSPRDAWWSQGR